MARKELRFLKFRQLQRDFKAMYHYEFQTFYFWGGGEQNSLVSYLDEFAEQSCSSSQV